VDFPKPKSDEHYFTHLQEKILKLIYENSGISQKKIASHMGISRQVASYHLTKMEQLDMIKKEQKGRESRYFTTENYAA
jgi:predicted transcriptional regulator